MNEKVVCLGDSLTDALGVPRHETWTALAQARLGRPFVNKGISGDTTGGMLARFGRDVLAEAPGTVLIMGGPNDFMAGLPVEAVKANITAMARQAQHYGIVPLLGVPTRACYDALPEQLRPIVDGDYIASRLEALRDWILPFARTLGNPCIDFAEEFQRRVPEPYGSNFQDGMHPTAQRQSVLADIVAEHPYFQK